MLVACSFWGPFKKYDSLLNSWDRVNIRGLNAYTWIRCSCFLGNVELHGCFSREIRLLITPPYLNVITSYDKNGDGSLIWIQHEHVCLGWGRRLFVSCKWQEPFVVSKSPGLQLTDVGRVSHVWSAAWEAEVAAR